MNVNVASHLLVSWSGPWFRVLWLVLALAAASLEWAESADVEDLTQYGREWEEIKTNWGSELDRYNTRMDELNKMPPGPERDGLISKEMQGHRTASQDMARQRQDVHDKVIEEVNRRTGGGQKTPDGRKVPEARQTAGTKVTDPRHRGMSGDTDAGGTARQADTVKKVLKDMGIKADVKTTPSTVEVGDDFNFTINKEGKLGKPGSGAHQMQVRVNARNKETYVSESMSKNQPGRDYVEVQDHKKKAMGGLKSNPEDLARNPDMARDMAKGASKTMAHLSDAEVADIMKKNNISGTPEEFRNRMEAIKGQTAAVTPEEAAKLQQASRDVFDKAENKTKTKADHEVARTREKIKQLEKAGAKTTAQESREKLVDSVEKISETGAANKEATRKGSSETAGKPTNEVSSRKPAGPAEPAGKAPAGGTSGQTAGKASPGPAAKGPKSSVEPSSVGKTRTAESSVPKGERGAVDKSATNKPSTPEEWRRWNEQRVPESVKQKGPGIPDSNTGRDFVKELPKNPTDPSPPAQKPFGSGMTPEQKAIYDKLIKEGVPHRAPPDGPAPSEPSGSKMGRTPSESITELAGKSGKTTPEPTAKGDPTPTEPSGKTTTAKTTAEPTGKPAGQTTDAPKGKGPAIEAPDAAKGRVADAPDAKPRVSGAPDTPKMGAMRKGINVVGEGMNAVGTLADAEDFKEAAKKGDVEGMMKTGARGVAGLTPLGSAALGAKDTYDMVKERRGDKAGAENDIAEANKRNEEAYELQSTKALRGAGLSPDQVKQIMEAKARGDEGPLNSKFKELNLRPPERIREAGPRADDTAWERTKDVAGGVATQGQKAGKFLNDTRKDLTEIGTGMLDKGTRDEVSGQVKENVSLENIKAGLDAHGNNKKADAERAAVRDELKNKLIEKGASRDEAEKAVREWDKGDRRAVNELRERIKKENSKNLPGETYDPRRDANFEPKGIGGGAVDIAQADESGKEFQQRQGGGTKNTTAKTHQNVMKQPESYTTDTGTKPDAPGGTAQTPFSPYPHGYPLEGQVPGVRVPWDTLAGSPGHGSKTPGRSGSSKGSRSPDQSSASKVPSNTVTNPGSGSNEPSQAQLKAAYNEGCMVGRQIRSGELSSGAIKELMRTKYDQGHQALKNEFRRGWKDCQ